MLDKSTERILKRMDRMGFAGAGEALREIERLRDVIDRAAQAWLSLDPPVQWEGDVGDAMVAAVAEIERLRGTLRHVLVHPWDWDVLRVDAALGGTWTSVRKGGY